MKKKGTLGTSLLVALKDAVETSVDTSSVGFEQLSDVFGKAVANSTAIGDSLGAESLNSDNMKIAGFGPEQIKAGAIVFNAINGKSINEVRAYVNGYSNDSVSVESMYGVESFSDMKGFDIIDYCQDESNSATALAARQFGMEAFDNTAVSNLALFQASYAMMAARQTSFDEMFFPTRVVTQDQGGIELVANVVSVYENKARTPSGTVESFQMRNIADANIDPSIISSDHLKLRPIYRDSADATIANTANFVGFSGADVTFEAGGATRIERPLLTGRDVKIVDLSAVGGATTEVRDAKDSVAPNAAVGSLIIAIPGLAADRTITRYLEVKLHQDTLARFVKAQQGKSRDVTLNYRRKNFSINAETTLVGGDVIDELSALPASINVKLDIAISGQGNLQTSVFNVSHVNVSIDSIIDVAAEPDQKVKSMSHADYAAIVATFAEGARVVGWRPSMYLTNSNIRYSGLLLNEESETEKHAINLSEPVYLSRSLASGANKTDSVLSSEVIVSALRSNNHHRSIETIENAFAMLNAQVGSHAYIDGSLRNDLTVFGRHFLRPYVNEVTIELAKQLNSLASSAREADIRALLLDTIAHYAQEAITASNIRATAERLTGQQNPVIEVRLGVYETVGRYLSKDGDTRTLGPNMVLRVEHTNQMHMKGKMYMSLSVQGSDNIGLETGIHAFVPELLVNIKPNNDIMGSTDNGTMGMSRNNHIWISPVMVQFTYSQDELEAAAVQRTVQTHTVV